MAANQSRPGNSKNRKTKAKKQNTCFSHVFSPRDNLNLTATIRRIEGLGYMDGMTNVKPAVEVVAKKRHTSNRGAKVRLFSSVLHFLVAYYSSVLQFLVVYYSSVLQF